MKGLAAGQAQAALFRAPSTCIQCQYVHSVPVSLVFVCNCNECDTRGPLVQEGHLAFILLQEGICGEARHAPCKPCQRRLKVYWRFCCW